MNELVKHIFEPVYPNLAAEVKQGDIVVMTAEEFKLLIRYYPFNTAFMIRDVAIAKFDDSIEFPDGVISCISTFPIAFAQLH